MTLKELSNGRVSKWSEDANRRIKYRWLIAIWNRLYYKILRIRKAIK